MKRLREMIFDDSLFEEKEEDDDDLKLAMSVIFTMKFGDR
jgi:hypothetical protein